MASPLKKPSLSRVGLSTLLSSRASRLWLTVWMSSLSLAACGFEPIYRADNLRANVISNLEVSDSRLGRQLDRALRSRIRPSAGAPWVATIDIKERLEDRQVDSQGVAQRARLTHRLELVLREAATGKARVEVFQQEQFLNRSDSGGDEVAKLRALRALAVRALSQKLAAFLQALAPPKERNQTR
jgi:hypothetical protein